MIPNIYSMVIYSKTNQRVSSLVGRGQWIGSIAFWRQTGFVYPSVSSLVKTRVGTRRQSRTLGRRVSSASSARRMFICEREKPPLNPSHLFTGLML